jgi:type 1 glutamine amidotransferase
MKRIVLTLAIAMTLCSAGAQTKVLVLTERGGLHEGFVAAALNWLDTFAKQENLQLRVINHPREVENENLANYKVFIQLNYPPYNWTPKTEQAFIKYIEEGQGGWVGFHHASLLGEFDGFPMWKWFSDFMGGIRFKNYIAQKATGTIHVEDKSHPVMKNLPDSFQIANDEFYIFDKNPRPNVHVIANVDEGSYAPQTDIKMGDHPVIWSNPKVKARNVYFLIGHDATLLTSKEFKQMFANAILWAAGK